LYFHTPAGKRHIVRGFEEADILSVFGAGGQALYERATAAMEAGTLFPGGKNQAIDALLSLGNVGDNVPQAEAAAADALFELFGATPQDGVSAWGTDTVAT
jgi:hypothetical protein